MDPNRFSDIMSFQDGLQRRVKEEEDTDIKIHILEMIQECVVDASRRIHKEQIVFEGMQRGFDEQKILNSLRVLKQETLIDVDDEGFIFLS